MLKSNATSGFKAIYKMMLEMALKTASSLLHLTLKGQNHKETSENVLLQFFTLLGPQIIQLHVFVFVLKLDSFFISMFVSPGYIAPLGYKFTENRKLVNQCLSQHGCNS